MSVVGHEKRQLPARLAIRLDGSQLRRRDDCMVRGGESEDRRRDLRQPTGKEPFARRFSRKNPSGRLGEIGSRQIDGARVPYIELLYGGGVGCRAASR
jgi:hypothetical protein